MLCMQVRLMGVGGNRGLRAIVTSDMKPGGFGKPQVHMQEWPQSEQSEQDGQQQTGRAMVTHQ